jgi:peptidoglycan hydrolase-like protein with peptidoglycan-binding domain
MAAKIGSPSKPTSPGKSAASGNSAGSCKSKDNAKNVSSNTQTSTTRQKDNLSLSKEGQDSGGSDKLESLTQGLTEWAGREETAEASAGSQSEDSSSLRESQLALGEGELLSRFGESNPEKVTQLQEMLRGRGLELAVDGKFGPETQNAVRQYQQQNHLKVDGIVGPETLGSLSRPRSEQPPDSTATEAAPTATPGVNADPASSDTETVAREPGNNALLQGLPPRAEDAMTGSQFMDSIRHLPPGADRERAILSEIMSGNIPDASRNLNEVVMNSGGHEIRLNAMSDYLAIGSDEDNVRIPMTPAVAQAIADRTGTSLPTTNIVDAIHSQSRQLHMAPLGHGERDIPSYVNHDQRIDDQLGSGRAPDHLVSGHKKDIVIPATDGRVAIYGGRWGGGERQPYSNVHGDYYEDYSHGARLISRQITVDGRPMNLSEALADPALRPMLTQHRGNFGY